MTRVLEPYEINYKDFIQKDEKQKLNPICRFLIYMIVPGLLIIKISYVFMLSAMDTFAANYPYSIQCGEI